MIFIAAVATARAQFSIAVLNHYRDSEESLVKSQSSTTLFYQLNAGLRDDFAKFLNLLDLEFLGLVQRQ